MLAALAIRDFVLIDSLTLGFGPGLTVLTGETGAGKSILLDALGLALGRKSRADPVRVGAAEGSVEAVFEIGPDHAVHALLEEAGLPSADEGLILRRVVARDGPSRAFVNDRRVSAETLRGLGAVLVEAHGQHDDRLLLDPAGHRGLLDAFAADGAVRAAVRAAWEARRGAEAALAAARAQAEAAARDAAFLAHAAQELEALDPQPGEDDALDAARRRLRAAAKIGEEVGLAAQGLGPSGAEGALADAIRRLERAAPQAEGLLDDALDALSRALTELGEAAQTVETALEALAFDPGELDRVEERLFALRAMARKHQVAPDDLPAFAADVAARRDAIEQGDARIAALEAAQEEAVRVYAAAASALSEARKAAASRLEAGVAEELPSLKLERARFVVAVEPGSPGPEGTDAVSFLVAANPGAAPAPLGKAASGGELSRLLLALKARLAARAAGLTMIFDEIDRGVGGATAEAVGRRLKRLAEGGGQVLVVTHSPQVAAQGARHLRIEKRAGAGANSVHVEEIGPEARREEIARMLAGETVTDAAREAAAALLA